ncbi:MULTISPECIES: phage virion morphogenesis protein [Pseudomonas]|uniref:phage virion morphogenesis protein n=1 Tax=Pseudomonas TaxID=286 RepID=UPI0005A63CBE|nr:MULTISPECIES: phage virion morphogenesis protein [Pseudomonas]AZD92042.1 phage virion morphogenesis protein [Pseudomonas chlororaphis subsp. aureofaciens]KAB0531334.1 phage virion morphogenesis protein [Pseudomonas chlororaphis subsp. aureofaciens]TSD32342.1 phage virion morphogenesis protein [Pseudomonas sp. ATCC 13985]WDG62916.1 phage virion morphogenesis protein [Pseudomonas chlororaphis]WDG69183.1 phage virion morphogenesis protein [Pseudomonas chlororaphis]
MFTVELDHQRLQTALRKIEWAVGDLAPLMRGIAAELASQTEENFGEEGRPEWEDLSDVTTARREKNGNWPGQMLQVSSAGLAASITTQATDSSALVGSNKPYAAMMQFGGTKSDFPHLWGDIPGRPYLPMDAEGELQPEAEEAILDLAMNHLEKAARL